MMCEDERERAEDYEGVRDQVIDLDHVHIHAAERFAGRRWVQATDGSQRGEEYLSL